MVTRIPNPGRGTDSAELRPQAEELRHMARTLSGAVVWKDTAEGRAFWSAVRDRFNELARIADDKAGTPPPLPDPPARPSSRRDQISIRTLLDVANGIDVEHHDAHETNAEEWSLYLLAPFQGKRQWIADYEIGTNSDQYTAEEAEALAYEYAERLLEACPQLRAHGINPKE